MFQVGHKRGSASRKLTGSRLRKQDASQMQTGWVAWGFTFQLPLASVKL